MVVKRRRLNRGLIRKKLGSICELAASYEALVGLWLFGSYAKGSETPLSDVDLAYLPREDLAGSKLERLDCDLYISLAQLLATDEITLVNLGEAPVALAFAILRDGQGLFIRDESAVQGVKERVLRLYPEIARLRRVQEEIGIAAMPVDRDKIAEQLRLLKADLKKLKEKSRLSKRAYLSNGDAQAVVERRFQTATEACVNIGHHLISALGLSLAEDYASVFLHLAEGGVLSQGLAEQMADMARFRNLLVHLYWKIDHEKIHKEMKKRIQVLEKFAKEIAAFLKAL